MKMKKILKMIGICKHKKEDFFKNNLAKKKIKKEEKSKEKLRGKNRKTLGNKGKRQKTIKR